MEDYQSLSHTRWQCKYHVIFIPKYRRRALFGVVRRELGGIFRRLAEQKECRIEEGHIMADHVHMLISVPPKLAVSSVVGYLKGKSAIHVARHVLRRERNYVGQSFVGEGILRRHDRPRYGEDPALYPGARCRRSATRPIRVARRGKPETAANTQALN